MREHRGHHITQVAAQERLAALTERELELLAYIAQGWTNASIGERLWLSPKTVETHVRNIFAKLDLPPTPARHRRVAAVLVYIEGTAVSDAPMSRAA